MIRIFSFIILLTFDLFQYATAQTPEENLKKLGIELTKPSKPIASYVNCVRVGNLLYLSGKGKGQMVLLSQARLAKM